MGRDLLGANSLEQSLHVVVIAEGDGVLSGVVWVLISLLHLRELVCIVALTILSLVIGFLPKLMKQRSWLAIYHSLVLFNPLTF